MKVRIPRKLTNREQKALDDEINRQLAGYVANMSVDLQAAILLQLHEQLGFGKKRILRFAKGYQEKLNELQAFYEMRDGKDTDFLYRYKLKNEVGINVEELEAMFHYKFLEYIDK